MARFVKYSTKYLPFAPGIPWKVQNGKYIVPEINGETWRSVMGNKSAVLLASGGLLESFYSLTILEALKLENPYRALFWSGSQQFKYLFDINTIAKHISIDLDINKYPTPVFFDKDDDYVFFNSLYNYITIKDFRGFDNKKENNKPIVQQIFSNSLMGWRNDYLPKLRLLNEIEGKKHKDWLNSYGISKLGRYVVYFTSNSGFDSLNWSHGQIREFSALLKSIGINFVICSNEKTIWPTGIKIAKTDIALTLIKNAWAILSSDLDYLLMTPAINNEAIIISKFINSKPYDLIKNVDFIESENLIYSGIDINPYDTFLFLKTNL